MVNNLIKIFFLILIFKPVEVYTQWSTDPYNNLIVGYGLLPEACSDSAGGGYITYEQNLGYPRQLILERLNRYGYKTWGGSKRIIGLFEEQSSAKITEDGYGGVIVSYLDSYYNQNPSSPISYSRLRLQRIDSSGNFLWGLNGVRVSLSETDQYDQSIVSDGNGGCIVAWRDTLNTLRAQKIDSAGIKIWNDSGICITHNIQDPILAVSDGQGGIFITWITPIAYVYKIQRVSQSGVLLWDSAGINIPVGATTLLYDGCSDAVMSGFNGTINNIIYITQKIDSTGVFQWQQPYITLSDSTQSSFGGYPIAYNKLGVFIFAWPHLNINREWDLHTQIIRNNGNMMFMSGGIPVSTIPSSKRIVGVLPSDSATSVYIWCDQRLPHGTYTQRLDTLVNPLWNISDEIVSVPELSYEHVVTDSKGGFIIIGSRDDFSIRAQQVSKNGRLGEVITNIDDQSRDNLPKMFFLYQNYPNPFNSMTFIKYNVPMKSQVRIDVFNIVGEKIEALVDRILEPGTYTVKFNADELSSGIYFYTYRSSQSFTVRKLIILK